ncbi:hypothetical protein CVT24_002635 [Panaeolus cyanescens]|uniref:Alanine dehydrogenase/pyridine nucleotide transhydrogenase N-terminal domain-containing protein n=1 Tax=Panaeolus cyanescens TaxID=181874 RepID=A0A409YU03_9AGAR|nr:hypothetical protein CVT24_002635 [Panaeolus cyanescens]
MTITKLARQVNPALKEVRIGVRREDPRRIWERRVPLTPDAVYDLVSTGNVVVSVQSCSRRIFKDEEYQKAGANVVKSVNHNDFDIVLGIKEPLVEEITPLKPSPTRLVPHSPTHFMFSHTIKGQAYNMPLLSKFVAPSHSKKPSTLYPDLIDFELITSSEGGKRTVGFGWFAGGELAGVLESLASMAQAHLEIGIASPFLYTPRPHTLPSLDRLRAALKEIGETIAANGTPAALGPFVIGLTGNGNVSQGCLSMLQELPIEKVRVEDLEALVKNPTTSLNKIYLVHAQPEDYFIRSDGGKYSRDHYYSSPQSYVSVFAERIAPYLTLFLNGTGWSPSFPRLMSNDQLATALSRAQTLGGARFTNIGDISCDVEGGLQFLTKATTISSPFYKVRTDDMSAELPAVQMMSVDILPASIPLDASNHFSSALGPYLKGLIECQLNPDKAPYPEALARARIASEGVLTNKHKWLQPAVDEVHMASGSRAHVAPVDGQQEKPRVVDQSKVPPETATRAPEKKHKILMLGSGMVAGPAVDLLASTADVQLVIGSNSLLEMQSLAAPHHNVAYRMVDIGRRDTYEHLIKDADVVISLLPAPMHPEIAKLCIQHRSHLITASYIAPEMEALALEAKRADITILNEIGLDPGIDHISARAMLSDISAKSLHVSSFTSFCGGLPAPEDSHVPLRYKFSWRPNGVLTAATNPATFKLKKEIIKVPGEDLLKTVFPNLPISDKFELEGIANRDSLKYMPVYRTERAETFLRGTLRYPGFCSLMQSFRSLGLLNQSDKIHVQDWTTFVNQCVSLHLNIQDGPLPPLSSIIPLEDVAQLHDALVFLGLARSPLQAIADTKPMPPLPEGNCTPLDVFAYLLSHKLKYGRNERDMVVLAHEVVTRCPKTNDYRVHTSNLTVFGKLAADPDLQRGERPASAMARTVGIPVALAARMVARNKETFKRGVLRPTSKDIFMPLMSNLEEMGLGMKEATSKLGKQDARRTVSASVYESYSNATRFERDVAGNGRSAGDLNDTSKYLDREWVDEWPEGEEGDFMKKDGRV